MQPVSHMVNITNHFFSFLSFDLCQWLTGCISSEEKRSICYLSIRQYLFVQQNLAVPVLLFDCSALTSGSCQIKQDGELSSHTIQKIKQTQTASFLYLSFTPPVPEDRSKPATLPALVYFQLICLVHFVFSFIYKCGGGIVCKCHVKKNV